MTFKQFASVYHSKWAWGIEHSFFMGVPMLIMYANPLNVTLQYMLFLFSALYMTGISLYMGARPEAIGLTQKHFKKAVSYIFWPTLIACILILLIRTFFPVVNVSMYKMNFLIFTYILISVPLQELVFRGFCLWRCKLSFKNVWFLVLFNSSYFAMFHMLTGNMWFAGGVFLINLFWSYAFLKYPNLYVFMISHAIIGTLFFIPLPFIQSPAPMPMAMPGM